MSMSQAAYLSFPQPEAVPLATTGTQDNGLDHEPRKDTSEPCKQCAELVEALEMCLDFYEDIGEYTVKNARAAIAKAKAGQS